MTDHIQIEKKSLKSVDVEQALLGGMLVNNDAIDDVRAILKPEHFSEEAHAMIYNAILTLSERGTVDAYTLAPRFAQEPLLERVGYGDYLIGLQENSINLAPLASYAETVLDLYKRRSLLMKFEEIVERLPDTEESFSDIAQEMDTAITDLDTSGSLSPVVSMEQAQEHAANLIQQSLESGDYGQFTQFASLNALTKAWMPGNFIVVGARPAMGKTAFSTEAALHFAKSKQKTLFMSLEMAQEELLERIAAKDLGSGFLDVYDYRHDLEKQREVMDWLRQTRIDNFWISDLSAPNIAQVRAIAKRHKKTHGLDFLVLDYLQLMSGPQRGMSEFAVTEYNSKALKALAKELKINIICLSQLSRAVEGREDKRPKLQDLRNSGSIEQDADKIIFLYREAYYLKQELDAITEAADRGKPGAHDKLVDVTDRLQRNGNKLSLIVAKNRRGKTGTTDIGWRPEDMRFWNLEK